MQKPLWIGHCFQPVERWQSERRGSVWVAGSVPDRVLVEKEPRFRHSYWNHRNVPVIDFKRRPRNFLASGFGGFLRCVPMDEQNIARIQIERAAQSSDQVA